MSHAFRLLPNGKPSHGGLSDQASATSTQENAAFFAEWEGLSEFNWEDIPLLSEHCGESSLPDAPPPEPHGTSYRTMAWVTMQKDRRHGLDPDSLSGDEDEDMEEDDDEDENDEINDNTDGADDINSADGTDDTDDNDDNDGEGGEEREGDDDDESNATFDDDATL